MIGAALELLLIIGICRGLGIDLWPILILATVFTVIRLYCEER